MSATSLDIHNIYRVSFPRPLLVRNVGLIAKHRQPRRTNEYGSSSEFVRKVDANPNDLAREEIKTETARQDLLQADRVLKHYLSIHHIISISVEHIKIVTNLYHSIQCVNIIVQ